MRGVPPDRQCTLPTCEREATDPTDPTPVCETHLATVSKSEPDGDDEDGPEEPTSEDPETFVDDPGFDGSVDAVREHYRRVRPVYEAFADLEGAPTAAFAGNSGWYRYRRENELELHELEDGHRVHRRAYTIERDFDELLEELTPDPEDGSWRSFYNIASWKGRDAVYAGAYGESFDDFGTGDGLAGYADMRGFGLWVDLDLEDNDDGSDGPNYKKRRGSLTDDERATVEAAYTAYLEEFADLYGIDPADVAAFDSGGGGYLYGPARATIPIADRYDDVEPVLTTEGADVQYADVRALIFKELRARMFAYATGTAVNSSADDYGFEGVETRVNGRVDGADNLLSPDWMQNRNRQSKAPLSIHGNHDVVVTPLRDETGTVDYTPTRVSAVDEDLIERGAGEAAKIVDVPDAEDDLEELTEAFVSALFPEYADRDDLDGWREILDAWIDDQRARGRDAVHQTALDERRQQERLEERRDEVADRTGKDPGYVTPTDLLAGLEVTNVRKDVFDALEKRAIVDVRDVIRDHCADAWNTSNRDHETTFDPSWRGSSSGKSCAVPNGSNGFVDNGCDGGGGPAKAYALGNGILPRTDTAAAKPLTGRKWGKAIDGLRADGYDIPVYVPEAGATNGDGEEYGETPLWALRNAAVALDVCDPDGFTEHDTEDGDTYLGFDHETYNATLEALGEHGVDHGREPVDGGYAEPTAALALARLKSLDAGQRKRYRRSVPEDRLVPSTDDVSERIRAAVETTLREEDYTVHQAPTGGNKTGVATETPWCDVDEEITGGRPVILFCETIDARDEAVERAREAGLQDVLVLKGYKELCPVARGDYDPANIDDDDPDAPEPIVIDGTPASEWFAERVDRRGVPISVAHTEFESLLTRQGRECPCCEGPYVCPTKTQWPENGLTDDDGPRYDLVIATDPFAYVPSLRQGTNVIHDEQPTYEEDFGLENADPDAVTARVRRAVTAFLGRSDDGPDTFEALVELARDCARCDAPYWNEQAPPEDRPSEDLARRWSAAFDALEHEPGRQWYFADSRAHTLAPALAQSIWKAIADDIGRDTDPDERGAGVFDANGRAEATVSHAPPRLDDDARDAAGWNRNHVTVTIDDENTIRTVRNAPGFSTARSVVGLDARPTPWLWQRNVHPDMTTERVLDREESRLWRRYERGQTVVQVGDTTRPAGKEGKYFNDRHARAIVEKLRDHFGEEFTSVGTAKALERAIVADEIDVGFRELLLEASVPEDVVDEAIMTYGEEKSRNDFAEELVGLVYGCIDPGDDYVLDLLTECGLNARPERSETPCHECANCEGCERGEECSECTEPGDGCHECDGTGWKRAHGRGFVGPDADHAVELLESVRATHVAQMVGRFGRSLDVENGETNLTFVATDAVPEDLVDYQVPGVEWLATDLHREILDALSARPSATTRELADELACSKEHVRQTLTRFEDRGAVRRRSRTGDHGADEWTAGEDTPVDDVQLRLNQIANAPVQDSSTWELAVSTPEALDGGCSAPDPGGSLGARGTIAADSDGPPPG